MRLINLLFLVFLLAATGALIRLQAAPGDLDLTFSSDGRVTTPRGWASSVAIQADGKIVVAGGSNGAFTLVRYHSNGSLDSSFDLDGMVTGTFGDLDCYANAVAIQGDGKIVTAGYSGVWGAYKFALARFNTNGSLDTSFDGDGKVTTQTSVDDTAQEIMLQSDGKIVVGGYSGDWSNMRGVVIRYNPDGSLDSSLDGDGKVTTPSTFGITGFFSIAIQSDSRIVAAGVSNYWYIGVIRFNTDGSLDSSFGQSGRVIFYVDVPVFPFIGEQLAQGVTVQPDGKIVVAGHGNDFDGHQWATLLARLNANGTFDNSFGVAGQLFTQTGPYSWANDLSVQNDGKIVAVGGTGGSHFLVMRYNPNGSLDSSYGSDGKVLVDFGGKVGAAAVALDSVARAVVAGNGPDGFAVARLLGDNAVPELVAVAGRVMTSDGRGLQNARVSITDSLGITSTVNTSTFGYYQFDNIITGQTYTIGAASKRFRFLDRVVQVNDNLSGVDFVALAKTTVRDE